MEAEITVTNKPNFIQKLKDLWKRFGPVVASFLGLLAVVIIFTIVTGGKLFQTKTLRNIVNQSVITAIVATGAVFLFSLGMIDLSLGSTCAVAAILAVQLAGKFNNNLIILLVGCVILSVLVLSTNGLIIGLSKLPSFIVTLVMMNILTSLAKLVMPSGTDTVRIPYSVASILDNTWFMVLCLAVVIIAGVIIYNFTPLGRKSKVLGSNRVNADLSGVNFFKTTFFSYMICGIAVGVGAFLLVIRNSGASYTTGAQIGFDVIICLVLGAMPISGGVASKISAGVIGSFTIVTLNNGLALAGVPGSYIQAIRAVVFLVIVTLLLFKSRTKLLA